MTKLERLIAELCPDGVEYRTLGEVCKVFKGKQLNKELLTEVGDYPAYNGGISYSGFTDKYNVEENTIIISQGGASAGFVNFVNQKFWANAHCYYCKPNELFISNRYLYHFMKMKQNNLMEVKHGAGIPALNSDKITEMLIPLPPLSIQSEIVRILDNFTELTSELTSELTARKKQYEYYRNYLLTFSDDVSVVSLGDIYDSSSGLSKSADEFGFGSPFLSFKTVFNNPTVPSEITDLANTTETEQLRYSIKKGDVFVTRTSESLEELGMSCAALNDYPKATFNGFTKRLRPKENAKVNPQFAAYFFRPPLFRTQIARTAVLSTRVSLNDSILLKIRMPLPTLEEQARIVGILDKFDALTTDIKMGLPAEIAARQKQYEYYRDKLLRFS